MNKRLENFQPRLKPGKMIPHGSKFTFELTETPAAKITLPMIMADFILLCSGHYCIREIVEKIYRKQGTVPFRVLLETLYMLHARGFLENSAELSEQPWLQKQQMFRKKVYWDWIAPRSLFVAGRWPTAFYLITWVVLASSLASLILGWTNPFEQDSQRDFFSPVFLIGLFLANSTLLSGKYIFRCLQILTLNGKVGEFHLRVSPWGIYFRTEDSIDNTSHRNLFAVMFHASQLFIPFLFAGIVQLFSHTPFNWLFFLAAGSVFWEFSPFRRTEFFNLLTTFVLPERLDPLTFIGTGINPRQQRFIFICSIWGLGWIALSIRWLALVAEKQGAIFATIVEAGSGLERLGALIALGVWLGIAFFTVHSFVETASAIVIEQGRYWRARWLRSLKISSHGQSGKWMIESLRRLPLFAHLSEDGLGRMLKGSQLMWVEAQTPILIHGDSADDLCVLLKGAVMIRRGMSQSPILPITIFGESALVGGDHRTEDVSSIEKSQFLRIPTELIRQIARESNLGGEIDSFMTAVMVDQFFASAPLFRKLPREGIDFLSARGVLEFAGAGQMIFRQGDVGEYFYMVIRGSVRVEVNDTPVKTISQGGFFGEISLIANIPRTAGIFANEPCVLFKISADAFWEVLVQHIEMAVIIEKIGEQRLQEDLQILKITG